MLAAEPALGSEAELRELLASPTVRFSLAPRNTHQLAEYMHRVGRLRNRPESWRDYFFPEAYGETGS